MTGPVSRRTFLRDGAVVAAAGAATLSISGVASAATRTAVPRAKLARSTFVPLVGRTFTMAEGRSSHDAILAEVNDLPAADRGDEDRFALVFHVDRRNRPAQGLKQFRHAELGRVDLFAGPVDRGVKALRFEAVVNRP